MAVPIPGALRALTDRVPRRVQERAVLTAFAVGWSVASVAFWQVRNFEEFLPLFWPCWYAFTAATCWAFLFRPGSRRLLILSGACSFTALLSRAGGVLLHMLDGHFDGTTVWYGVIGLVVYPLFAVALLFVWQDGFGAMQEQRRRGGTGGPRVGAGG